MNSNWEKWKYWEYWPVQIVYAFTFFYWMWAALRFRNFHFYKWSNPGIKNGGLYGDSKWAIYQLLPAAFYPKTVLVVQEKRGEVLRLIEESNLSFPLVAKPDVGCRGVMVKLVSNESELSNYMQELKENFLLQEWCSYPNEIGLFYIKNPRAEKGFISGITEKKFLSVIGNGSDSIEVLMSKSLRAQLQIEKLRSKVDLSVVLAKEEERLLVPFGNHNRGTEFLDGAWMIDGELEKTFDDLLGKIEGFNYGRLDIRFLSLEDLKRGKNFSIIELNGAKSEPTHIYDPKYSFWKGQREIFRHQREMMSIISLNRKRTRINNER